MIGHALEILEYRRALDWVAGFAATAPGRRAVASLRPKADRVNVSTGLRDVQEVRDFLDDAGDWVFPELRDPTDALKLLSVSGAVLPGGQLFALGTLLTAGRTVRTSLRKAGEDFPGMAKLRDGLFEDSGLEARVVRSVDAEGQVLDAASRDLGRIRSELRGAHQKVVRHLEGLLDKLKDSHRVPNASVTIRDGRYVMPVRREGKGAVGGYIHDESATGATIFVEPPSAIGRMNRVRELEREEYREVQRILKELSGDFEEGRHGLQGSLVALTELDSRTARAWAADRWEGFCPTMSVDLDMSIVQGRHPLLVASGVKAVPFDLKMGPTEGVLLVTGPNTGGKTVFLKSVGLITTLAQAGVIPPVGPQTTLPVFADFFADIGDEQSLDQSLSTFSAHLRNLKEIVEIASERSLVLVDELGTGTDPNEGEALARALVEELASRGCLAIVTSHLGGLKRLAEDGNRIVNGSMQFDANLVAPTYRFNKGRPGRSYGLAIARRLGLPAYLLDRAEAFRDDTELRVDHLLATLEVRERESAELVEELRIARERVAGLEEAVEGREETLRASERDHETKALSEARKLLMDARSEVEATIVDLRAHAESGEDLDAAAKAARRRVEAAAREHESASSRTGLSGFGKGSRGPKEQVARKATPTVLGRLDLSVGVRIRVKDSGATGTVLNVDGSRVVVDMSGLRLTMPAAGIEALEDQTKPKKRHTSAEPWRLVDVAPSTEVDLRGRRVDEVVPELVRAIDQAVLGDLDELRIIHGKGTGAVKKRVVEILGQDSRIQAFRPGGPGEGGFGVTVASLR